MAAKRAFQLLIKPVSADCNLRCEYCFYLRASEMYPNMPRHLMSDEVLETMISGLMKQRFPESVFAWQGGEPTLAGVDFFRKVVELQKKHGVTGQSVGNGLQTNGVLIDDAWCRLFLDYKFLIGLSIDGPEDIHNRIRKNAAGRGSWDKAMAAARLMESHRVPFNILCVINAENVRLGADLLRWFVGQGFDYVQLIPCLESGLPHSVPVDAYGDFLCDTFDYWAKEGFGKVSVRDFDAMLAMELGERTPLCTYGRVCNHYILIEHNGDVYPCDFFAYPEWRLGNVTEHPIEWFTECDRYKQFAYQKSKVASCRGCEWRAMCYGGCQKDRLYDGSFTDPTPLCPAYKKLFAHAVPTLKRIAKDLARRQARSGP